MIINDLFSLLTVDMVPVHLSHTLDRDKLVVKVYHSNQDLRVVISPKQLECKLILCFLEIKHAVLHVYRPTLIMISDIAVV